VRLPCDLPLRFAFGDTCSATGRGSHVVRDCDGLANTRLGATQPPAITVRRDAAPQFLPWWRDAFYIPSKHRAFQAWLYLLGRVPLLRHGLKQRLPRTTFSPYLHPTHSRTTPAHTAAHGAQNAVFPMARRDARFLRHGDTAVDTRFVWTRRSLQTVLRNNVRGTDCCPNFTGRRRQGADILLPWRGSSLQITRAGRPCRGRYCELPPALLVLPMFYAALRGRVHARTGMPVTTCRACSLTRTPTRHVGSKTSNIFANSTYWRSIRR